MQTKQNNMCMQKYQKRIQSKFLEENGNIFIFNFGSNSSSNRFRRCLHNNTFDLLTGLENLYNSCLSNFIINHSLLETIKTNVQENI